MTHHRLDDIRVQVSEPDEHGLRRIQVYDHHGHLLIARTWTQDDVDQAMHELQMTGNVTL